MTHIAAVTQRETDGKGRVKQEYARLDCVAFFLNAVTAPHFDKLVIFKLKPAVIVGRVLVI